MKKDYMLSYVLKFCKKNSLQLICYDTGVYCVIERSVPGVFFAPGIDRAYFPSLTKLFYSIQYGDIKSCGFRELITALAD